MDNQQGPTVEHRELYTVFCNNLSGQRLSKRMNIWLTETLRCPLKTNAILYIQSTRIKIFNVINTILKFEDKN